MRLQHNLMMTTILAIYEQSMNDLVDAIESVPDSDLALPMGEIVTHPAWTISHLCGSAELICQLLNKEFTNKKLTIFSAFGPGSQPDANRASYLTKKQLITKLRELHK